ncbi:MAG TPA: M48 family metallopeptidase [Vicinamibacterales bacterium]|jgi:hypothetical protein|nr:M48 family metallopeptidase [Vicinamibacterales bacterium]
MRRQNRKSMSRATTALVVLLSSVSLVVGQTQITAPPNKYKPADDVKLGRDAARQVEQQLPLLHDDLVESYVQNLGERLVAAIPPEFQHSEFRYTFKVVNVSDINAFALPGGPMYVNRGMIESARTEGEVAGVMAHELSHVALRHGTAQQTKATPYEVGSIAGQILGAVIGGAAGAVVSQGAQFGFSTAFLRYSREYEKQADLLGSHIMARAGYDPHEMANMFQTIERTAGNGPPQFLSDHPNPSNRIQYINDEAGMVTVTNPVRDERAFRNVKAHLSDMPKAPTTDQVMRSGNRRSTSSRYPTGGPSGGYPSGGQMGRVDPPSTRVQTFDESGFFRIDVPANWQELRDTTVVTFAPNGGYGNYNGQNMFTHGLEVGLVSNDSHNLQTGTDGLIAMLGQNNPHLRGRGTYDSISIDGRPGLRTVLNNVSDVTRRAEQIELFTTQMNDGSLFYVIGVAPSVEFTTYQRAFDDAVRSIQLNDSNRSSRY